MERALAHAEQMGQQEVTGDNVTVVIFAERLSPAVRRLYGQNMSAEDAAHCQSARNIDPRSASNIGSDAISMTSRHSDDACLK